MKVNVALITLTSLLLSSMAHASSLSILPAVMGETLTFEELTGVPTVTNFGIPSSTVTTYHYGGSASASISNGGTVLATQAAMGRLDGGFGDGLPVQAQSKLTYYEVVGPPSPNSIPLNLQANLSGSGDLGLALFNLQYPNQTPASIFQAVACGGGCTPGYQPHVSINQPLSVSANQPIEVQEEADALTDGTYTAQSSIDPFISIDPSFLTDNPGYALAFSDGIDNSPLSPTPLPPAAAMFATALAALGTFAWRRRALDRSRTKIDKI